MALDWQHYPADLTYDELFAADGKPRAAAAALITYLQGKTQDELEQHRIAAELAIRVMGISFTVYTEGQNVDRAWPFDVIPRVIDSREWAHTAEGLRQRARALNHFIADIYADQRILKAGVVPPEVLADSVNFRPQCVGHRPPGDLWAHICGSDLVRDDSGTLYVLEDNLRVPSGVSYMVENRMISKRVFPELFKAINILPVDDYATQLFETLADLSPRQGDDPTIVLLTPGIYNSAYFEHAWLAQQMGIELVVGPDLYVDTDACLYMRTVQGATRVDVVYRRVDDLFIDPEVFREDSMLGVHGLMRAWLKGNVAIANAPGAGVADDKVIYSYVPDMIKYYLGEEAKLPNVPSFRCMNRKECDHVLANLDSLVVKPANESGGYGMLIGPRATAEERTKFAELIRANPRNYMAQPTLSLSTAPILMADGSVEPRHLDLRPFILSRAGHEEVTMGGLTRVAMVRGSLVVNSSQGGGAKDTWVVDTGGKA